MATTSATDIGREGLTGWRVKVAQAVGPPVSKRTPLSQDQVEAAIGATFLALSAYYVVSTLVRIARS